MLGAQVFQKPALETAEYARTVAEPMPPDGYFGRKDERHKAEPRASSKSQTGSETSQFNWYC